MAAGDVPRRGQVVRGHSHHLAIAVLRNGGRLQGEIREIEAFVNCLRVFQRFYTNAFRDASSRLRIARENRMGTSDVVSAPPAIADLMRPVRIISAAVAVASFEEMHAMVTVCAGKELEMALLRATSRARFYVLTTKTIARKRAANAGHHV